MGIEGLNEFLRKQVPQAILTLPSSRFKNQYIAIDGNNFCFTHFYVSQKRIIDSTPVHITEPDREAILKLWLEAGANFNRMLTDLEITPIWVFDGVHASEKSKTRQERTQVKEENLQKVRELKDSMKDLHPLQITGDQIQELRNLMKRITRISGSEDQRFKERLQKDGYRVLIAPGEGEKLCSMLCRDGLVSAAYSTDSDTLAYGCPITISEIDRHICQVTLLSEVLYGLQLTQEKLTDMCILLGNDYNTRIPQFGPVKIYKYIQTGTLDELTPEKLAEIFPKRNREELETQLNELKIEFCRQEFAYQASPEADWKPERVYRLINL